MSKYRIDVITKQRNTIIVEATDEDIAVQGFIELLDEEPEGYLTGSYDKFLLGPDVEVTELEEVSI
jgi:hypothetical protein